MNKTKNLIWFLAISVLCALAFVFYNAYTNKKTESKPAPVFSDDFIVHSSEFSDGLNNPDSVTTYELDEDGFGIAEKSVYYADINEDNKPDRITKIFNETGNAHSYYEYKIELNLDNKFLDITPKNFRTVNGADCDLQQIQFIFKPKFKIVLISRDLGETWNTPNIAKKKVFKISEKSLHVEEERKLHNVCDVKELF